MEQYLATAAQVIPALGIALVIEARYLHKQVGALLPRFLVLIYYLLHGATLVLLGLSESAAFSALLSPESRSANTTLIQVSLTLATSVLIMSPAYVFLGRAVLQAWRMGRTFVLFIRAIGVALGQLCKPSKDRDVRALNVLSARLQWQRARTIIRDDKLRRISATLEPNEGEDKPAEARAAIARVGSAQEKSNRAVSAIKTEMLWVAQNHAAAKHLAPGTSGSSDSPAEASDRKSQEP